mmetsp:Transcript_24659/g.44863  ORF Transcript_24659/g.44863 Transcript_24659/m.44863 type:complete len:209 (-) Transcript_24659:582-1208(-)
MNESNISSTFGRNLCDSPLIPSSPSTQSDDMSVTSGAGPGCAALSSADTELPVRSCAALTLSNSASSSSSACMQRFLTGDACFSQGASVFPAGSTPDFSPTSWPSECKTTSPNSSSSSRSAWSQRFPKFVSKSPNASDGAAAESWVPCSAQGAGGLVTTSRSSCLFFERCSKERGSSVHDAGVATSSACQRNTRERRGSRGSAALWLR